MEVVAGHCLRPETSPAAMQGPEVAFCLLHSMADGDDVELRDVAAAHSLARAGKPPASSASSAPVAWGDPEEDSAVRHGGRFRLAGGAA